MNEEQHLTYELGMTNVPSDATCDDNGLEESIGLTYAGGEHRVIQKPVPVITSAIGNQTYSFPNGVMPNILYIHKVAGLDIYIGYSNVVTQGHTLYDQVFWGTVDNGEFTLYNIFGIAYSDGLQITSTGKTIIIGDATQKRYAVWKPENSTGIALESYLVIDHIPEPVIDFKMVEHSKYDTFGGKAVQHNAPTDGIIMFPANSNWNVKPKDFDQIQPFNDLIVGSYEKNLKTVAENKQFAEPFLVRYALEMFDGSYTMFSAPILMFPCVSKNSFAVFYHGNGLEYMRLYTESAYLALKANYDYTDLSDIVKGVAVFASAGIRLYDTTVDQEVSGPPNSNSYIWFDTIEAKDSATGSSYNPWIKDPQYHEYGLPVSTEPNFIRYNVPLVMRSKQDIEDDIRTTSIFYKIFTLGIQQANGNDWERSSKYIKDKTLVNLTSQETLVDDYFSHCQLVGKSMTAYNNRLLLSNTQRGFYEGCSSFLPYYNNSAHTYDVYVTIKTSSGNRIVRKVNWTTQEKVGLYFFYPDPRAIKADFYLHNAGWVCTLNLKEHERLNGAYYFEALPDGTEGEPSGDMSHTPNQQEMDAAINTEMEKLYNQIWVSEVNNPFVFRAEGNVTVGNGEIIGVSSLTQALSQGQFGQYPLIVFSTDGIWAASTGSTGLFTAVHPMSREVALKDNPCITQTDGAIFFATKKGLMLIVGSDVRCVSEQLSGKTDAPFAEFLQEAVIAYDYRDGLLWIFKDNSENAWIYNIKSGTFGRYALTVTSPVLPITVVNSYPDYLIQGIKVGTDPQGTVYSLMERVDINDDNSTYAASMKTRAMKLGGGMTMKSIMRMKNIFDINGQDGSLSVQIWAKNNLTDDWVQLTHLRGVPHKYYQLRYTFTNLLAKDRFAGTVLITQERRTNKLR